MATIVFDIETSALPLDNFDEAQQEYLFREAEKLADETAKSAKREEITKFMSLWPFTSQVVCIAMLNAETLRGQVLFMAEDFEEGGEKGPPAAPDPAKWEQAGSSSCPARTRRNCSRRFGTWRSITIRS